MKIIEKEKSFKRGGKMNYIRNKENLQAKGKIDVKISEEGKELAERAKGSYNRQTDRLNEWIKRGKKKVFNRLSKRKKMLKM